MAASRQGGRDRHTPVALYNGHLFVMVFGPFLASFRSYTDTELDSELPLSLLWHGSEAFDEINRIRINFISSNVSSTR